MPCFLPTLRRSGLRGGWLWFCCLLSRRRPELHAAIFFGDEEVAAVKALLALGCKNYLYGSFFQQIHHLCAEDLGVLAAHCGGEHIAKLRWSLNELESITSSYRSHYPR